MATARGKDYDWQIHLQAEVVLNATSAWELILSCSTIKILLYIFKGFSNFVKPLPHKKKHKTIYRTIHLCKPAKNANLLILQLYIIPTRTVKLFVKCSRRVMKKNSEIFCWRQLPFPNVSMFTLLTDLAKLPLNTALVYFN
jgi:hypothetical protein